MADVSGVSSADVSLEAVGNAEQVIKRLIDERKVLESGAAVLQTYRMVRAQIESASVKLKELQAEIEVCSEKLKNVNAERLAALDKAEKDVASYTERRGAEAEVIIERFNKEIADLQLDYNTVLAAYDTAKTEYERDSKMYDEMISRAKSELEEMRQQHAALAEAVSKAAVFFRER